MQLHVSENNFDDKISERTLDNLLSSLDPLKLFFTQNDINDFKKSQLD